MQITDISSFLRYYSRVKDRTRRLFAYIPPEKMEIPYAEDKFTAGDLIRHLACIERWMYAETVRGKPSLYAGCGTDLAEGKEDVIDFYNKLHDESAKIFSRLSPEDLNQKCMTPAGIEITTWKWLRAMVEHEVHHRGQLYMYLSMWGITSPPIYGLTSEEVILRSGGIRDDN